MPRMRTAPDETATTMPPRQRLLQAVLYGQLTPAEAEADATRLGLRPLLDHPDPSVFDPLRQDRWTLPMTIAWIVWRTPEAVREYWDAYVIGCERWREAVWNRGEGTPTYSGFEPGPLPMPSWPLLALREDYPRDRTRAASWRPRSPHDAREELWKALEAGDIEADAIDLDTRRRVDIPASAWKSLELYSELEGDIVREDRMSRSGYEDLRFPVQQVVDAWPDRVLSENLPALMVPEGSGYMPLSAAAQWIATRGGTLDAGHDTAAWDDAYRQLKDRIASGEVAATGKESRSGRSQPLDPALFSDLEVHHLFSSEEVDHADDDELYLWATPYVDKEHWREKFSDDLRQRRKIIWSKLVVNKADIAKWWEFSMPPLQSGFPGRPSSAHLIRAEFEFRCAAGTIDPSLIANASALCDWLRKTHPKAHQAQPKSVADHIRAMHNGYWAERKMKVSS